MAKAAGADLASVTALATGFRDLSLAAGEQVRAAAAREVPPPPTPLAAATPPATDGAPSTAASSPAAAATDPAPALAAEPSGCPAGGRGR